MPRGRLFLLTIALPLDYAGVWLAGLFAYQLRFKEFVTDIRPVLFNIDWPHFAVTMLLVALGVIILFAWNGLYDINRQYKLTQELVRISAASTLGLAIVMGWFFFNPQLFGSRFIILVAWALIIVLVSLGRLLLRWLRLVVYRTGFGVSRVALIGTDNNSRELAGLFAKSLNLGLRVVWQLPLSQVDDLKNHLTELDEVIVGDPTVGHEEKLRLLEFCSANHLSFRYAADMFEAQTHNVLVQTLAGVPLVEIKRTPLDGWGRVSKRFFDLILATLALLVTSPILLLLAGAVLLESGWPFLVALQRVGEGGKLFYLYKFRSMVKDAHQLKAKLLAYNERADGPLFKMSHDPRVTRLGAWLRLWSLDELPQLWNILIGQMSLVGPRPHEPGEVAAYNINQRKLLSIKPGLTGLAQISGRSNLTFAEEVKLDLFYIENWSLRGDFVILIKTIGVVLSRRNAV